MRLTAALGSALLLLPAPASAQDAGNYPNRPVMMIVPFAPGGASDFVARTIQTITYLISWVQPFMANSWTGENISKCVLYMETEQFAADRINVALGATAGIFPDQLSIIATVG
jgi:hypothetical protein